MRKDKKLIDALRGLVDLVRDEAKRNPLFAEKLELILEGFPTDKKLKGRKHPIISAEIPDLYAEWQSRGERDFRLWLREMPLEILRAMIKRHELDPSRRAVKWKEREKLSAYIADQLQVRLSRGSKFMRS